MGVARNRRALAGVCILIILFTLWHLKGEKTKPKHVNPWELPQEPKKALPEMTQELLKNPLYLPVREISPPTHFANTSLCVVNVATSHIWRHTPVLLNTVLTQYPNRLIFSGDAAKVGNDYVVNAFANTDNKVLEESEELLPYRIRRYGSDEYWGWDVAEYWHGNETRIAELAADAALHETHRWLDPEMEWVVVVREDQYVSPRALDIEPREMRFTTDGGPDILVLSRMNFEQYEKSRKLPTGLKTLEARNISSTTIRKSDWCEPLRAFAGLQVWEFESLFGRDVAASHDVGNSSHTGSAFYRDFILPYIAEEKKNWIINPVGPVFIGTTPTGEEVTKPACMQMCRELDACLAWEWRNSMECRLETEGIRRGMEMNAFYKNGGLGDTLVISGWMIDRIRQIRLGAECDTLELDAEGHPNDDELTAEGWLKVMRDHLKVEDSWILQSAMAYEHELDNA